MLQFILGASKSGKTTYINEKIAELCEDGQKPVMLIVPEQFTFEAEKNLFKFLGGKNFKSVKVISFTRLATEAFKQFGTLAGIYANDCAKTIVMDMALEQIIDELHIYKKSAANRSFSKTMLDTVTEFKNAGVLPEELVKNVAPLEASLLRSKLKEIALIYGTYNAILLSTYLDPLDDLMRAARLLQDKNSFCGYTIFIDEFKGFTANEKALIKIMLKSGENLILSLCMDAVRGLKNSSGVFSSVQDTYNEISRLARDMSVKIRPSVNLSGGNFDSPELLHIEENIFSSSIMPYENNCKNVALMLCKNEYDEVLYTLSTIANIIADDNSICYNDIAIISRDLDSYISPLEAAFSQFEMPYFTDKPKSVANKPLIRFVQNLLDCVTKGYTSENILGMLKCGMTSFSVEEVAELENYLYVWDIKSKQWQEDFRLNPRGYSESTTDEDNEVLARINVVRAFVNGCVKTFKQDIKDTDGIGFCKAVVLLLEKIKAKEKNEAIIKSLLEQGDIQYSSEYERVWEILMELLDTLANTIGKTKLSAKRFQELFTLVCSGYDMGSLPQSLDTIIVGSADRIRTTQKKIVFILGANENVFPLTTVSSGVFSDKDRRRLLALDINIAKPSLDRLKEERFIAYKALTSPSERLYVIARKADISGEVMATSIIFSELERMFGEGITSDTEDLNGEYFCRSKQTAFSHLAKIYNEDTPLRAAIIEVLRADKLYAQKLEKLERFGCKKEYVIENKENALKLFGKDMNISPTRVEGFYQCHFRYFCEQGLRAFPLRRAELNPLETGTLIHNMLYVITKQLDLREGYDEKAVKSLIKTELDRYIDEVMGGKEEKTKRFLYLYNRMRISIFKIIERLHLELLQSEFEPCGFEYDISEDSEITPLMLYGDNDSVIKVSGKIDRIDRYISKKGEKYIRIVDYKTGKKDFKLNDVLYGLNLQMLIYLHCISQNGKGEFGNSLPAGILYMRAGEPPAVLERNANVEKIEKTKLDCYKTNGLLLDDIEVLGAMEKDMKGLFIPVSSNKDGSFSKSSLGSLVSLTELAKINKYMDSLILRMADELHNGKIEAFPIKESCDYCQYMGVCGRDKNEKAVEYLKLDNKQTIEKMQQEEDLKGGLQDGKA